MIHTLIGQLTGWERKYREALAQRDENAALATGHAEQARVHAARVGDLTSLLHIRERNQQEAAELVVKARRVMGLRNSGQPAAKRLLDESLAILEGEAPILEGEVHGTQ